MSAPLTSGRDLNPGDVCLVSVKMRDKRTGDEFWWKRFVCVVGKERGRVEALTLKMQIDDRDLRILDFNKDVITKVEEAAWPQGVIAMRMKWIAKGVISLGDTD